MNIAKIILEFCSRFLVSVEPISLFGTILLAPALICICLGPSIALSQSTKNIFLVAIWIVSIGAAWIIAKIRLDCKNKPASESQPAHLEEQEDLLTGSKSKTPRQVVFNQNYVGNSPSSYQLLMLVNPTLWLMIYFLFLVLGPDNELREHGREYAAKVTNLEVSRQDVFSRGNRFGETNLATVSASYSVNGKRYDARRSDVQDFTDYQVGSTFKIIALPSSPALHEQIGSHAGAKQYSDTLLLLLFAAVNLALEYFIWAKALRHRRLVKFGTPVVIRIRSKNIITKRVATSSEIGLSGSAPSDLQALVSSISEDSAFYLICPSLLTNFYK